MGSDRQLLVERGARAFADPSSGKGSQRRSVTLIEAGWGSSGFYPEDVLRRDGPRVFNKGTFMYLNHPTPREEAERPERDVMDRVGKLVEDARMEGSSLKSVAEIYPHWVPVIDAMADDIGLSIRAWGPTSFGEEQGRSGQIVESIVEKDSVDFVTEAGAGGSIGPLIESARGEDKADVTAARRKLEETYGDKIIFLEESDKVLLEEASELDSLAEWTEGDSEAAQKLLKSMLPKLGGPVHFKESGSGRRKKEEAKVAEDQALSELRESVRQLQDKQKETDSQLQEAKDTAAKEKTRADRAEEGLRLREAGKIVSDEVGKIEGLPGTARQRIIESALRGGDVPTMSDGRLDGRLLEERARAAVKEEQEYLANLIGGDGSTFEFPTTGGGGGGVRGLSESGGGSFLPGSQSTENADSDLEKVFQKMGLSEAASKHAAEGR